LIDEELLQELLAKASGLYNNGDYSGAIAAWKEVLAADPSSQKAREGIQMATLLLGDFDPAAAGASDPVVIEETPADGAPVAATGMPPVERAVRLDQGIARVRALLSERKFGEAVAGARSLVPIDPDSTEVQRLVEEAQQSFEAAPFIEEHLTLAKELATEERFDEAIAECRKIFTLDPAHPDGHALMQALKERLAAEATGDPGGATMRIDRADLNALQGGAQAPVSAAAAPAPEPDEPPAVADTITFDDPPAPIETAAAPAGVGEPADFPVADATALPDQMPDDLMNLELSDEADASAAAAPEPDPSADAVAHAIVHPPAGAATPEPFVGADLEAELGIEEEAQSAAGAIPVAAADEPIDMVEEMIAEESAAAPAPPDPAVEEVVEARTVVAPAVRRVPRDAQSPSVEEFLAGADKAESIPLAKAPAKPAASRPGAVTPSPTSYTKTPDPSWEEELESLNMKSGEHDLVGHTASRNPTIAGEAGDVDLSSLLGDEMGDLQAGPPPATPAAHAAARTAEPRPATAPPALDEPAPSVDALLEATSPHLALDPPPRKRARVTIPPMMFAGLGVVILVAAAGVWWFVYQPKNAAAQAVLPPAGNPPADQVPARRSTGPIPTPMASTSRQPPPTAPAPDDEGGAPESGAPDTGTTAPTTAPAAVIATVVEPGPAAAAPPSVAPPPPPKPVRSAAELRAEVAQHMALGRRFQAESKWQEARGEFAAAFALDPVNFECKELLDHMQAKVDEDTKVRGGLDEAKRAFADKDYQGALWKLYRLPRDPRLGNIDLYIRNAWFNWAIVGLKGGDATDAKQKLTETLSADPDDADAQKLMDVAERYSARAKDRAYYSFVDTLRFRPFDQK
jgi:tetratricopeptide (TPR) repeat protein